MQVWQYLTDLGLIEMDPDLPVLEWAVHFKKESVHAGLISLARKLQTEFNAKPHTEEFETQWALRINKWAVEATNQFYLVLHDLSQYVRHGARKEPLDFGDHPVATSAQEPAESWGQSWSWEWSSGWQQPWQFWQQHNSDAPPRRRWADTSASASSDWGQWRPER